MANEAPGPRPDAYWSRVLFIIAAVAAVWIGVRLYPYISNANVRWLPFILMMIGGAVLSGAYLGVMYIRKNRRN